MMWISHGQKKTRITDGAFLGAVVGVLWVLYPPTHIPRLNSIDSLVIREVNALLIDLPLIAESGDPRLFAISLKSIVVGDCPREQNNFLSIVDGIKLSLGNIAEKSNPRLRPPPSSCRTRQNRTLCEQFDRLWRWLHCT